MISIIGAIGANIATMTRLRPAIARGMSWVSKISTKMAIGSRIRFTEMSGIRAWGQDGHPIITDTGRGLIPGGGRGLTMLRGDTPPSITAGGSTSTGAGDGSRGRWRSVRFMRRLWLPSWVEAREAAAQSHGSRWDRGKYSCPRIT